MITDKKKTPIEIFIREDNEKQEYSTCQDECARGVVKYTRDDMIPNREEMLEFAMRETFHLDDRLCPYSREELRAEAWLMGYYFAKRHQMSLVIMEPVMCETTKVE